MLFWRCTVPCRSHCLSTVVDVCWRTAKTVASAFDQALRRTCPTAAENDFSVQRPKFEMNYWSSASRPKWSNEVAPRTGSTIGITADGAG